MSEQRKPIARLTFRRDKVSYGILSVWRGKFAGTYDISREKPSDKRQTIGLFDALKSWGLGEGYLSFSIESEREPYGAQGGSKPRDDFGGGDFGGGDFGGSDIPFMRRGSRGGW